MPRFLTELLRPPPPVRRYKDQYAVEASGAIWTLASPGERIVPNVSRGGKLVIPGTRLEVAYVVATAWIDNPEDATDVVHRDGNRKNVAACNLSWKQISTNKPKGNSRSHASSFTQI